MIASLYTRVVLIFLSSVIGGTVIGFFVATWIFEEQLNENLQITLLDFGQDVAQLYETLPVEDATTLVAGMKQLNSYHIRIYEETGELQSFGSYDEDSISTVNKEEVKEVLAGELVQVPTNGINPIRLAMPLNTETGIKAMFVESVSPSSSSFLVKWIFYFLAFSLISGSVFVLVAALFLVRPIKKLTEATRRIAGGDFDVKLTIKQKGELGTLARSFEEMMRDLQQLEQMRKEFVSNVSHEVQSPLTSISGYAAALKQVDLDPNDRNRYVDVIIAEAGRMSKMSGSLLKLSLLESESQQLRMTTLGLDEQIRRVIVAIQPQWSARTIGFELDLREVEITADHELLNQVWMNLLGNSIKFSEENSVIGVSIKQDSENITVRISDTGIGISPEDQKRIFERFFKADRSHSKYEGSGMGLAIVKQIVMLHQGEIRVESELNRGTTFIVTLPIGTVSSNAET